MFSERLEENEANITWRSHMVGHKSGSTPISCVDAYFAHISEGNSTFCFLKARANLLPFLDQEDRWPQLPCGQVLIKFKGRERHSGPELIKQLDF